jgi:protein involved in polysaccharide export with SLBB domain
VGPVLVAGVRYAELPDVIRRRVAQVFRNFELSVSLGQLRGVRVYVTGFVERPGAYSVNSLSSVLNALLRAGGPSAAGSLRNVTLQRGRQTVARFDLYDFLLKGDRSADMLVQPEDVINIGPVGPQVGVIGSVNRPAILEIKPGETVDDALRMVGGFSTVADRSRLAVERLEQRTGERIAELPLPISARLPLSGGDVLRAFSAVESQLSVQKQNKRVIVEGEVQRPGEYVLPSGSSIADALRAAGGLSPSAYVFGTLFTRQSVQRTQQENYDRALRDLETELSRNNATQRTTSTQEVEAQTARAAATSQLITRLRAVKPNGRVVLQMTPESTLLPELPLEDGDRISIPTRGTTVGVFGSVFNTGSFLWTGPHSIDDYLRLAGGPTRGADRSSVFVIRANGSVVSALQDGGSWFSRSHGMNNIAALPGDTIFVPEEMEKTTFLQSAKDWTQIFYQFGLGAAAINVLRNN